MRDRWNKLFSTTLGSAAIVGVATLLSRITGFIRDIMIAAMLGTGPLADIFVVAFRLPNLFRRLFAEGAFSAAFVPVFSKRLQAEGRETALILASDVFAVLMAVIGVLTVLSLLFMPALIFLIAQGFADRGEEFALAVHYSRLSFPYLLFMSVMAFFAALLNAEKRFAAAALVPIFLNLVSIIAILLYYQWGGAPLDYLVYGLLVAGIMQAGFVVWAAWRRGLIIKLTRPRLKKDVRYVFYLAVPGMLAGIIDQLNLIIGTSIATQQSMAPSWLYYADRLYQLPMGLIGIAISVALLPTLARALQANDQSLVQTEQDRALWAAMLFTLPATAGMFILALPITEILFVRGAFTLTDAQQTAIAVQGFCLGLPAFVAIRCLQPCFFAREDMRTPLVLGAIGTILNIIASLLFFDQFGHIAIAVATSLGGWLTAVLMLMKLLSRGWWRLNLAFMMRLCGQLCATIIMSLGVLGLMMLFPSAGGVIALMLLIIVGGGIYFLAAFLCGALRKIPHAV